MTEQSCPNCGKPYQIGDEVCVGGDYVVASWYGGHCPASRWEHKYYIEISIFNTGEFITSTAGNLDGSYTISDLASGHYIIEISSPGYVTQTDEIVIIPSDSVNLNYNLESQ